MPGAGRDDRSAGRRAGRRRTGDGASPRRVVLAVALAALLASAGCADGRGGTPVPAAGTPATVPADAAASAGYEHVDTGERSLNATLSATLEGDVEATERVDVAATVPVARYRRATGDGPSVVAVAASPSVEVIENPPRTDDPLSTLSTAELVGFVQSTYADPADLSEAGTREATLLGSAVRLVTYHGTATRSGQRRPVTVHVARAGHDGDVVTVVAVHPRGAAAADRVADLLGAVTH